MTVSIGTYDGLGRMKKIARSSPPQKVAGKLPPKQIVSPPHKFIPSSGAFPPKQAIQPVAAPALSPTSAVSDAEIHSETKKAFDSMVNSMSPIEQAKIAQIFSIKGADAAKNDPAVIRIVNAVRDGVARKLGVK